jgi:hypothetical protein
MADATWENIKTIRNTDMVFINGQMEDFTSVIGAKESNMVSEFTKQHKLISNMDFGKKEKELNGLMTNKSRKSQITKKTSDNFSKNQRTNNFKYINHLINLTILINSYKKYKRDLVLLLTISLIEQITAKFLLKTINEVKHFSRIKV